MESFFQVPLAMNCMQYLFHRLRSTPAADIQQGVRFLNRELPSLRLRSRVVGILNRLMYDHILTQLPFVSGRHGVGGWQRRGEIVRVAGENLFPPIRSGAAPSALPELVWVTLPPLRRRTLRVCNVRFQSLNI